MNVKLSIAGLIAVLALSLGGCATYGQTGVLFTPFGVAGIHKFAPPNKAPDDIGAAQKTAEQLAKATE
jgi:hypothetical protein